ncbi:TlpA family protein disulfide reductase [Solirubrobacter phytolaccae]|uniref:TlpA family protein disulfide reductase n=1 Tax=Solirubrobacter phytolaccae TaxID=1404360 RepID=A0A9X3NCQ5_9ACTN|nr:TlpA disulfide reductase family protein [Solirubrobacter phytolaccae]MDA0183704.1 TlpA family protein disulfide reductase [Solirubrobacter phytolaccae]
MKRPGILIVVFIGALLLFITFNTIVTESEGSKGLEAGEALPPFAMPLSTSSCEGRCDANVATDAGQGAAGARPACEVRGPEILNVCELREQGPFVLAFVFHPVDRCREQLPVLERVAARHSGVAFRVVAVRADAGEARGLKSALPVGYDHDGAVANEYAVVVCPTITYVGRDGRVVGSTVGSQTEAQLESWVRRLE